MRLLILILLLSGCTKTYSPGYVISQSHDVEEEITE